MAGIISLDWPGKVVVSLEQCWWSWRISWLLRVIWGSYTGSWLFWSDVMVVMVWSGCNRHGISSIELSGPGAELVVL